MHAEDQRLGLALLMGEKHYRALRWPPQLYDRIAAQAFSIAVSLGLRDSHRVWEAGCGSLGLGRLLVAFLRPDRYCGTENEAWLLRDGLECELGEEMVRTKRARILHWHHTVPPPFEGTCDGILIPSLATVLPEEELAILLGLAASRMSGGSMLLLSFTPSEAKVATAPGAHFQTYSRGRMADLLTRCGLAAQPVPAEAVSDLHWVACSKRTAAAAAKPARAPQPSAGAPLPQSTGAAAKKGARPQTRNECEIERYRDVETVHDDLPPIHHYWANKFLVPMQREFGFDNAVHFFRDWILRVCREEPAREHSIVSLGAGNCDLEVQIAEHLLREGQRNFRFECVELNPHMLARAATRAAEHGVAPNMRFVETDIGRWKAREPVSVCLVIQALHHFEELEVIFERIREAIHPGGVFLTTDIIGRNGHMRWPEAYAALLDIWRDLPARYKYNHLLKRFEDPIDNWDCSAGNNEGIRAQDILPLLLENFGFEIFVASSNLIDCFVDRGFGPNFDVDSELDRNRIDAIQQLDDELIDAGRVKPCRMTAVMRSQPVQNTRYYRNRSPERSVRLTDARAHEWLEVHERREAQTPNAGARESLEREKR